MSSPLHWSFCYEQFNEPGLFTAELLAALESAHQTDTSGNDRTEYLLLPNYWSGYRRREEQLPPTSPLAFGAVQVERTNIDSALAWRVVTSNAATGERLELGYQTDCSPLRQLQGPWSVTSTCEAPGGFSGCQMRGSIETDGRLFLQTGNLTFPVGQCPPDRPLLCTWTLLDVMGELAQQPAAFEFALLEDLTKLKPRCRVRALDTCHLALRSGEVALRGFVVFGEGMPPHHYWLNEQDRVVIAGDVFQTCVLSRGKDGL